MMMSEREWGVIKANVFLFRGNWDMVFEEWGKTGVGVLVEILEEKKL